MFAIKLTNGNWYTPFLGEGVESLDHIQAVCFTDWNTASYIASKVNGTVQQVEE